MGIKIIIIVSLIVKLRTMFIVLSFREFTQAI